MATVEDILMEKGPDVVVADPSDTVAQTATLMAQAKVGSVIIKDGGGIAGIFTERDLLVRVVARGKDPKALTLADVMSAPVKTCHLHDDIQTCGRTLAAEHIRHLAVVEQDALVGLIGLRDILAVLHDD